MSWGVDPAFRTQEGDSLSFTGFLGSPAPITLGGPVAVLCLGLQLSGVGVLNLWFCQETLSFEILMHLSPPESQVKWPRKVAKECKEQQTLMWGGTRQDALRSYRYFYLWWEGNSDDLWTAFWIILPLSWTIAFGFCPEGWLTSLLNVHMATPFVLPLKQFLFFFIRIDREFSKRWYCVSLLINNVFKSVLSSCNLI